MNGIINKTFPCPIGNQWSFINNNLHTQNIHRSSKGSSSLDRLYSRKIRKQLVHHKQVIFNTFFILMFENIALQVAWDTLAFDVACEELSRQITNTLRLYFLICKTATICSLQIFGDIFWTDYFLSLFTTTLSESFIILCLVKRSLCLCSFLF